MCVIVSQFRASLSCSIGFSMPWCLQMFGFQTVILNVLLSQQGQGSMFMCLCLLEVCAASFTTHPISA